MPFAVSWRSASVIRPRSSMTLARTSLVGAPVRIAARISANFSSAFRVRPALAARSGISTSSKCFR
jgi:hypothetical protein